MKVKNLILLAALAVIGFESSAHASALKVQFQDISLPTQAMLERDKWAAPLLLVSNRLLSNVAGPTSAAATTVSTFAAQPDFARNLTLTPDSTGNLGTCVAVVTGKNIYNKVITENFTASGGSTITGSKAFKTVTSILFPANCETTPFGVKWSLGIGSKLGLRNCMDSAGDVNFAVYNNVKEVTAPTMAADATHVESNTATFSSALNGSINTKIYYIGNGQCR